MEYDLADLRESLDNIDHAIMNLLAERFRVTRKVGLYKKANGLPPVDASREAAQFARLAKQAEQTGVDPDFTTRLFRLIIDEVVSQHKRALASDDVGQETRRI